MTRIEIRDAPGTLRPSGKSFVMELIADEGVVFAEVDFVDGPGEVAHTIAPAHLVEQAVERALMKWRGEGQSNAGEYGRFTVWHDFDPDTHHIELFRWPL